jgi:hypothetical protein
VIDGSLIVINGKNRDLICRINAPDEFRINLIGGAGRRFESDGTNYLPQVDTSESGWGRAEITAKGSVSFEIEMEIRRKE